MPKPVTTNSGERPRALSRAAGFTLVELMLAITVLGILASLALPSLTDLVRGQRVKTASSDVYASLIYARSEAIKRAADVLIVPTGADWAAGWQVTFTDASGTTVLKVQDAITGVTVSPAAATITFRRDGRTLAAVDLTLSSPASPKVTARCVQISLSGRPNIRSDSNGNAADGCQ